MQAFAGKFPADSYKIVFLGYKTTYKKFCHPVPTWALVMILGSLFEVEFPLLDFDSGY